MRRLIGIAVLALAGAGAAQVESPTRSVRAGVYTEAQALRGRTTFQDVCLACHPDPLWRRSWPDRTVGDLYEFILQRMPDDNPGALHAAEVADLLAYIFSANTLPAGPRELPADAAELRRIRIEEPVP